MTLAIVTPAEGRALHERANEVERPPLVAPVHGNGKLYRGGIPGHRGGSGRPADKVRRALLSLGKAGIANVLKPLIAGTPIRVLDKDGHVVEISPDPTHQLRAIEIALRYGLGTADKVNVDAATRIETEKPILILPELGSEWTEADLARLNGPGGRSHSTRPGHVHISPDGGTVTVDL